MPLFLSLLIASLGNVLEHMMVCIVNAQLILSSFDKIKYLHHVCVCVCVCVCACVCVYVCVCV